MFCSFLFNHFSLCTSVWITSIYLCSSSPIFCSVLANFLFHIFQFQNLHFVIFLAYSSLQKYLISSLSLPLKFQTQLLQFRSSSLPIPITVSFVGLFLLIVLSLGYNKLSFLLLLFFFRFFIIFNAFQMLCIRSNKDQRAVKTKHRLFFISQSEIPFL